VHALSDRSAVASLGSVRLREGPARVREPAELVNAGRRYASRPDHCYSQSLVASPRA
jgi:hypothetical protein